MVGVMVGSLLGVDGITIVGSGVVVRCGLIRKGRPAGACPVWDVLPDPHAESRIDSKRTNGSNRSMLGL